MNRCAREQCQPLFTQGLPLPAADLSESSRELLKSLALPDQRSSTDFKPRNSPLRLPEGAGESLLLSRRSWMQLCERLAWGCDPSAGAVPSQRRIARCTRQKYLKIREKLVPTVQSVQSRIPPGDGWKRICGPSAAAVSVRRPAALGSARASSRGRFADGFVPDGG